MRITFVYPDLFEHYDGIWTGQYYRGLAYLSAVLKKAGHQTSLIHVFATPAKETIVNRIKEARPDLIAFSTTSHMFPLVKMMSTWIKESGITTPIACGGIHPTLAPEETINHPAIDIVCQGEGEAAMVDLCDALRTGAEITRIPNIWSKKEGILYANRPRPLWEDIDSLPYPDTELFDYENLTMEKQGYASVAVSRGCPYNCTYCCNHALKKVYENKDKYVRRSSVDKVIGELEQLLNKYSFIRKIIFEDDILFVNKEWAREFVDKYGAKIGLPFECQERVNVFDEEMAMLLKKAGCRMVKFGLESGNEDIRQKVLRRKMSQTSIKRAVALVKDQGIASFTYNIIGLPFETPSQLLETIKINAEMAVDHIQHTMFYPYKNTELYNICVQEGFLTGKESLSYFDNSTLQLSTISPEQVTLFHRYFNFLLKLYKLLYNHSPLHRFISNVDSFLISNKFPFFCKYFLNYVHSFYMNFVRPIKKRIFYLQRGW